MSCVIYTYETFEIRRIYKSIYYVFREMLARFLFYFLLIYLYLFDNITSIQYKI